MSRTDLKRQAHKIARDPDQAGPGWIVGGVLVVLAVVVFFVRSCQ